LGEELRIPTIVFADESRVDALPDGKAFVPDLRSGEEKLREAKASVRRW
jgi:hypothetical protein